jgi:hypothetical protein
MSGQNAKKHEALKKYLMQAFYLNRVIDAKIGQLQQLKEHVGVASPRAREDKVLGGRLENRTEGLICKLLDMEEDINKDIEKLYTLKKEIEGSINKVSDQRHKLVLTLRYLNFKNWGEVADIMGYCERNIYNVHEDAMDSLNIVNQT